MSFEEEFDSIIRQKAEEEKYPFDENNWDKASSLLNAERKATQALKLKKFYLPAVLIVALGSAGFIAFAYFNSEKKDDKNVAVNTSVLPSEKSINTASSEVSTPDELKTIQPNSDEKVTSENNLNTVASVSDPKVSSVPVAAVEVPKNSSSESTHPATKKEGVSADNFKTPLQQSKFEATDNKNKSLVNEAKSYATPKQTDKALDQTIPTDQTSKADHSSNTNNFESTSSNASDNLDDSNITNQNSPLTKNNSSQQNKENETFVENPTETITNEESTLDTEHLSAVYSSLPFETNELEVLSAPFIYLNRYDDDYYKNTRTSKKHYLNIEIGANYLLGWNAQKGTDGQGVNGFAGFNYGRYVSNKISISVGLQAYNIANIKQPFYLISSKEYGFGSKNIYTRVTSNQLYYIALPLKFNYAINSTNIIGFGVNVAYLVGADNTVSKYYLLDNEEKSIGSSTTHNTGIYNGINMVNMMLSAHYKTQFGKRIGLNLEFNYGLSDIFKNTDAIKTAERPMGIRLGLSYTLFDK